MHAFLVTGGTQAMRLEEINKKVREWQVASFDQVILKTDTGSIGIDQVRQFQRRLSFKPYTSKQTAGVVQAADKLTIEAQNGLLKTIEEPPGGSFIIAETANPQNLLPTVVSRCQIISLGQMNEFTDQEQRDCLEAITKITQASPGRKLQLIESLTPTREDALGWVGCALTALRGRLHGVPAVASGRVETKLLRGLLTAHRQLSANVNPRLVLDNLFLSLER